MKLKVWAIRYTAAVHIDNCFYYIEFENRRAYLPELENKKKDYVKDLSKFESLIDQLVKHKDQLVLKTEARKVELDKLNTAVAKLEQDNKQLKHQICNFDLVVLYLCGLHIDLFIATQELSADDVKKMNLERERLHEALQIASTVKQALQQKSWDTENSLKEKVQ